MARRRHDRDDDFMRNDRDDTMYDRRGPSQDPYDMRDSYGKSGKNTVLIVLAVVVLLLVGIAAGMYIFSAVSSDSGSVSVTSGISDNGASQNSSSGSNSATSDATDNSSSGNSTSNSNRAVSDAVPDDGTTSTQGSAPSFPHVTASSELEPMSKYAYYVSRLADGDFSTAWIEGVDGYGVGQSVTFTADRQQLVSGIRIMNGYCRNKDRYYRNSRVRTLSINIPNQGTSTFTVNLTDQYRTWTTIHFDEPIPSDTVTLTILDTIAGTQYDDTGLTEVEFF